MRTLFYQCPAGISGDMNLGAMVALGVDPSELEAELRKLPLEGWSIRFEKDNRGGITGTRCDVILEKDAGHDHHHHEHEHGEHHHHHSEDEGHSHAHSHTHDQSHSHEHGDGHHHHHRTFRDIREMIEGSALSDKVKADAIAAFQALAEAEGGVHGMPPEEVHFHEVGAVDSIIDMVGAAICWDLLGVEEVACSALELGGGTVQCAHGRMPVPAPATARLVSGLPTTRGGTNKETTTPTGAALLVGKQARFDAFISGVQVANGVGIGQRKDPNLANVVYVELIDSTDAATEADVSATTDTVIEFAANLDDMTGEAVAFLCDQLFAAGALDVWQTPATFKKGRTGIVVHALADDEAAPDVEAAFFRHSSTLGVRSQEWNRAKLEREIIEVETEWGPVRIKQALLDGEVVRVKPEYEDCKRIAEEQGFSLAEFQQNLTAQLFTLEEEEEDNA